MVEYELLDASTNRFHDQKLVIAMVKDHTPVTILELIFSEGEAKTSACNFFASMLTG